MAGGKDPHNFIIQTNACLFFLLSSSLSLSLHIYIHIFMYLYLFPSLNIYIHTYTPIYTYSCLYSVTKLLLLFACLLLLQFEYLLQSDRPSESSQYHRLALALCSQTPPLRLCKSFSHCMAPAQLLPNTLPCGHFV